ncbi:SDR family NAD(P)-dependent oxidoreductase, partial [Streptomyces gobitricini]
VADACAGAGGSGEDLADVLRTVIADLTGYPEDILTPDMALEADLGIDSIKRVQILAALRKRLPRLAEVEVSDVAALRTLGDIIERLGEADAEAATGGEMSLEGQAGGPAPPRLLRLVPAVRQADPPGLALPHLHTRVLITDDGGGVAAALAAELGARGVTAEVVTRVPGAGTAPDAGCVVLLQALRAYDTPSDGSGPLHQELVGSLRELAGRMSGTAGGSVVVVHDAGGDFGSTGRQGERAYLNGAAALARTAAREWPHAVVKAVDCQRGDRPPAEVARSLAEELLTGGGDPDVALAEDGTRYVHGYESAPAAAADVPSRVGPGSFLVVTGGGRGITADCLLALAGRTPGLRLLLLGRTPLTEEPPEAARATDVASMTRALMDRDRADGTIRAPAEVRAAARRYLAAREVRDTVRGLERAGASVRYAAVDARDSAAVRACLKEARTVWGPVTGLVHAAGVIADKPLAGKTPEQVEAVFSTKIDSLRSLLEATADDPLDAICLFSSVSAAAGNPGQADYAAANAVLDHLAVVLAGRRPQARVVSLAWGAWRGGMVTPELQEHFERQGTALIAPEAGAAAFAEELTTGTGPPRILLVPDTAGLTSWRTGAGAATAPVARGAVRAGGESHPELADHAIAGRVVLPVATAVEWLARAVPVGAGGDRPFALHDVRVRGTVALERFPYDEWLTVHAADGSAADGHRLELRAGGRARFTAVAPLRPPAAVPRAAARGTDPLPAPCPSLQYGGEAHFHGPLFRVVEDLRGCDSSGAYGTVRGLRLMGWPENRRWRTDPALVDGAMQLAVVWGEHVTGRATLPMAVERCEFHRPGPAGHAPVTCRVTPRSADALDAVCDALLLDEDGGVRAALYGIHLVVRPS